MNNKLSEPSDNITDALNSLKGWKQLAEAAEKRISALLAELEAAMKQNQELARQCGRLGARAAIAERKLATPLQLTDERTLWAGEDDYDTGHVKGWNANRIEQAALLKKQGFTVGDE